MLSKVSGDTLGVAKSTNNVIVVCPATVKAECYLDGLKKIYDDVRNKGVTNAVVLMAIYFDTSAPGVTDPVCISRTRPTSLTRNESLNMKFLDIVLFMLIHLNIWFTLSLSRHSG
jgi:hypothetical protein